MGGIVALGESDGSAPSAGDDATTVAQAAERVPTDQIHHVYVTQAQAAAARAAAADDGIDPVYDTAAPKTKPGEIPPASVGNNGSFDPPSPSERRSILAKSTALGDLPPARSAFLLGRTALAPPSAPAAVNRAIGAANAIVGRPYIWGGGHGSWNSKGYDCSGAVSYALGGGGLLNAPLDSGHLERWGEPGPGKWITVYANPGHTYAVIAGLRWDTVGDARGTGPRWHAELPYPRGYVARHPAGY